MNWKAWRRVERCFYHSKVVAIALMFPGLLLMNALDAGECWARRRNWASRSKAAKPLPADGFEQATRVE